MIASGGTTLIARLWRGWATVENAHAYEELFRARILPSLHAIDGFAGDDPTVAHVTPEARQLLTRFEETVTHYDVAFSA